MKLKLFTQVQLTEDIPQYGLKRGDRGIIVEYYPMPEGEEDGYSIEGLISQETIELSESKLKSVSTSVISYF